MRAPGGGGIDEEGDLGVEVEEGGGETGGDGALGEATEGVRFGFESGRDGDGGGGADGFVVCKDGGCEHGGGSGGSGVVDNEGGALSVL